jgi:DNA-binding MarR family transcriptional regulator
MGRGLSELQKRILVYAKDHVNPAWPPGSPWFLTLNRAGQHGFAEAILPGKWGQWTQSDIAAISRALRRLEQRGLIIRVRGYRGNPGYPSAGRTGAVVVTPAGEPVVEQIKAEKPAGDASHQESP